MGEEAKHQEVESDPLFGLRRNRRVGPWPTAPPITTQVKYQTSACAGIFLRSK